MPRQAQSTTQPLARRSSEIGGKRFLEMQANVYSDKSPWNGQTFPDFIRYFKRLLSDIEQTNFGALFYRVRHFQEILTWLVRTYMSNVCVVVLCGLPGAGKSTFCNALQQSLANPSNDVGSLGNSTVNVVSFDDVWLGAPVKNINETGSSSVPLSISEGNHLCVSTHYFLLLESALDFKLWQWQKTNRSLTWPLGNHQEWAP